ncbi:MAG: carbohydrate ABC transporter permease [Acidimicrobiales bacterium]|nr:carbohydrate ABC transporter permease [Acidimicrobiales bacterium]
MFQVTPDPRTDSANPPPPPRRGGGRRDTTIARHAVLIAVGLLVVAPLVWLILAMFRAPRTLFSESLPFKPHLANLAHALSELPWSQLLLHTVTMAIGVSLGQLLSGLLAAYAFSCWQFRGQRLLMLVVIGTWLVPFQVTILPNYVLLSKLGLLNSVAGVIVPQLSSTFAVLLLRQHLKNFPSELIEAARIDGLSSWSILWRVVVPNLGPSLAALEILLFIGAWNEYLWPLIVYRSPDSVLQVGISHLLSVTDPDYGALLAAAGLATLPLLVLYLILQRRIVDAFVRSGLR